MIRQAPPRRQRVRSRQASVILRFTRLVQSCALVLLLASTRAAAADPPGGAGETVGLEAGDAAPSAAQSVRLLAEQAVQHYREGDYQLSLELFQKAHQLDPHPLYLYSQAQCQRHLERLTEACDNYQAYLAATQSPKPEAQVWAERLATSCTIQLLKPAYSNALAAQGDTPTVSRAHRPPASTRISTPPLFWTPHRLGWTALAAGTGAALASGIFLVQQRVYQDDLKSLSGRERATNAQDYLNQQSKLLRAQKLTWAFAGVAAALGATGALLLVLPLGDPAADDVTLDVGAQVAASYRHRF